MSERVAASILESLDTLIGELRQFEREGIPGRHVALAESQIPDTPATAGIQSHPHQWLETDQDLASEQLTALDGRLRQLLESPDFAHAASRSDVQDELVEKLRIIDRVHKSLIKTVSDHQRFVADALQQLRQDRRYASLYDRVLRHSL